MCKNQEDKKKINEKSFIYGVSEVEEEIEFQRRSHALKRWKSEEKFLLILCKSILKLGIGGVIGCLLMLLYTTALLSQKKNVKIPTIQNIRAVISAPGQQKQKITKPTSSDSSVFLRESEKKNLSDSSSIPSVASESEEKNPSDPYYSPSIASDFGEAVWRKLVIKTVIRLIEKINSYI